MAVSGELRACPRRGCYRVVARLNFVRITEGLEELSPRWVCDSCLEELRAMARADLRIVVTVDRAGELT